jgi:hypothetical protein
MTLVAPSIGTAKIPKKKVYRDAFAGHEILKAKYGLKVNEELRKEMEEKDNGHNEIWD